VLVQNVNRLHVRPAGRPALIGTVRHETGGFCLPPPADAGGSPDLLAAHADTAKIIAGGQSLVPVMNMRLAAPAELIDVNGLPGMAGIVEQGDCIEAGALARHCELAGSALVRARCRLLALAAETIGHYVIRQRGSLGGSLAHADPTAQLPLIAVTLDAQIDVASRRGRRTVAAADFFLSVMTTALEPDEIIVAVRFPAPGERSGFSTAATATLRLSRPPPR
jgi:carbon-monoxide dehydrogenase medium subunit